MTELAGGAIACEVRSRLWPRRGEMASVLGELVSIESGSDDLVGLAAMADRLEEMFGPLGSLVRHPIGPGGAAHLEIAVPGTRTDLRHLAVLGHYDTVWPRGTLDRLAFSVDEHGIARGPGCLDMKGGLTLLYFALEEMAALSVRPRRPLRVLVTCDEEVRSRTARELIRATGNGAAAALVLEAPLPGGTLKTARKGAAIYRLVVEGRAAHAGIEPEKGVNAIVELAHQVHALDALNAPDRGTTVNVGVIQGGSRVNVVAAHAEAEIDVRVATMEEAARIETAITNLDPVHPEARLIVISDLSRPPMERTPASGGLFARARAIAAAMGVELAEGSTGGASDGNLVAAAGVPTLDGLGPEGGGAHADDEHVLVDSMPHRAALLVGLLAEI
jgi:glutamate carboxypeptidase